MRFSAFIAACLLTLVALASGQPPAPPAYLPVAHSALVTVDGALAAQTLLLRVRRTQDQQPVSGAELSVTVDGRSVQGTVRPDGTWAGALTAPPAAAPGRIEIVVAHDGVREVLDGQLPRNSPPPAAADSAAAHAGGAGFWGTLMHKQASWWILNVLIVLIGVIAVSRRMS